MSNDDLATRVTELERRLWWQALRTSQLQAKHDNAASQAAHELSEARETAQRLARELAQAAREIEDLRVYLTAIEGSRFWKLKIALQPCTRVVRRILGKRRR